MTSGCGCTETSYDVVGHRGDTVSVWNTIAAGGIGNGVLDNTIAAGAITLGNWHCTCPAVWLGVVPPEPCDFCKSQKVNAAAVPWDTGLTGISYGILNGSTNVEAAVEQLSRALGARIGANGLDDEHVAAFDAWQEVLGKLRELKLAVRRAVEAEAPK